MTDREKRLYDLCVELAGYMPDSGRYMYVWDECSNDEQEAVADMRRKANVILGEYI